jgi:hypothetical protein
MHHVHTLESLSHRQSAEEISHHCSVPLLINLDLNSPEPNDVDLAMIAPKGKAPQSPNRTILILASYNFSQPAKSFEESVHKMKKPSHNRMHIRPQNAVFYFYLSILATKYERQAVLTALSMHVRSTRGSKLRVREK